MKKKIVLLIATVLGVMMIGGCGEATKEEGTEKEKEIPKEVQEVYVNEDFNVPEKEIVNQNEEVDFYDFYDDLVVSFEGANGIGKLKYEYLGDYTEFSMDVSLECSKKYGLSNGDVVTITPSKTLEKHYMRKGGGLSSPSKDYVVSGLPEVKTFDAFKGLQVTFDNISPRVSVTVDDTRTIHPILNYTAMKTDGSILFLGDDILTNGEEIKICISDSSALECYEQFGEVPETLVKTYKVEGMPYYYLSFDDVADGSWNTFFDDSKEKLLNLWDNREQVKEIRYIGKSICVSDNFYYGFESAIDLSIYYEITVQYPGEDEFKYYAYQGYTGVYYNQNEDMIYADDLEKSLYSWFTRNDIWYRGYQTLNELYEDNIHPYRENSKYSLEYEFESGFEYDYE